MASLKPAVKAWGKIFKPKLTIDDGTMLRLARAIDKKKRDDDKNNQDASDEAPLAKTAEPERQPE